MSSEQPGLIARWLRREPQAWDSPRQRSKAVTGASLLIYLLAALGVLRAVVIVSVLWTGTGVLNAGPLPQIRTVSQPGLEFQDLVIGMPLWIRLLSATPTLIVAGTGLIGAFLLASVLAQIARGAAFAARTRLTLARLSLTLIAGCVLAFLIDSVAVMVVQRYMDRQMVPLGDYTIAGPSFPIFLFALGIVAAALLFAFRDGAALEKEAEGVI